MRGFGPKRVGYRDELAHEAHGVLCDAEQHLVVLDSKLVSTAGIIRSSIAR